MTPAATITPDLASQSAKNYLRLHLCPGVGPIRFAGLLRELGDIDRVLGASAAELARVEKIGPKVAEAIVRERGRVDVEGELALAEARGVRILCLADDAYPRPLRMIDDPPACLYVRGELRPTDAVALAVVGARHCSRYGAEQAERFAALLSHAGLTIVSGMARGIDAAAHRGALSGGGRTIAVMGCGLCHLYPPESAEFAERIVENGAIVSELPMNVAPDSKNFPPRNRIIAGLSLGVLVVEAAKRSGALISARLAGEYNREVFAVPGRIDLPQSEGCHELIKTGGAKLVTKLEDILEELGEAGRTLMASTTESSRLGHRPDQMASSTSGDRPSPTSADPASDSQQEPTLFRPQLSETESRILGALAEEPMTAEALCEETALAPAQIARSLTTLQLKALVRRVAGDQFERAR